ncbi:MerR family DNA-binding protein [Labrys monachus]|uniref:Transcription regulator MerR DNA binding domain-containing protein n=1 Tax=Labrys monachus TaxID=217067 RepID=A0ABU0FLV6_9HYPH|nr:hypothetical protein [Labrys monachus]
MFDDRALEGNRQHSAVGRHLRRQVIHAKADEIDRKIRELTALRDTLRHIADCPAPSHMECPTFRRLVDVAGKRSGKRGKMEKPKRGTGPT